MDLDEHGATSSTTQTQLPFDKPLTERRKKEITKAIVDFIAMDMRPISVIEGAGFIRMVKAMAPGYTIPCRTTITKQISLLHDTTREKLKSDIDNAAAVAFTTDAWTSVATEAYMAVTCHFISDEWELEGYVLETKELDVAHTGANIAERLSEVAEAYDIPNYKRVAIVHDNASNMKLCTATLKKDPEHWGKVQGVYCAGHTLQLCINASLAGDRIRRMVAAGRNLVTHFRKSTKATTALKAKQDAQGVVDHALIQDVNTRWNSTLFMLARLVEQRWPITAVLSDSTVSKKSDRSLDLTSDQWTLASDVADVLDPFVTLTELFSLEENVSLSATLRMLNNLKKRHLSPDDTDSPAIRDLKATLVTQIDTRWGLENLEPDSIYLLSAALDPRYKHLKFLNDEVKDKVYTEVRVRLY